MISLFNKIARLPSSTALELKLKDWIKGLGLVLLLFLSETLPQLKEIITGHDFGFYNEPVKVGFVVLAWFVQRWAKNNSANTIVPPPQEDLPNAI